MRVMRLPPLTRGFATWLALFALGVQIVASFGHVHLEGIARSDPVRLARGGQTSQSLVGQPPSTGGDDDDTYCPICASVYLTANSFVPIAPVLRPPSAFCAVEHFDRNADLLIAPRRTAFQSRAPPLA
jgi:hypothetical protein